METISIELSGGHSGRLQDLVCFTLGGVFMGEMRPGDMPAGWPVPVRGQRLRLELSIKAIVCEQDGFTDLCI